MADPSEEFLTVDRFCTLAHVSTKTAQRWRLSGDGPLFIRAGKSRVLYRRADVDTWLKSRTFRHRAAEATARHAS